MYELTSQNYATQQGADGQGPTFLALCDYVVPLNFFVPSATPFIRRTVLAPLTTALVYRGRYFAAKDQKCPSR